MESGRATYPGQPPVCAAMQRDMDALRAESPIQQQSDDIFRGLAQKTMIVVESVTETELKFLNKPQLFHGNYQYRFCPMRSYPYYEEADLTGNRYYVVQDNFGVWLGFAYSMPD